MERLLTAYQEDLLSLDELRHRVPELRAREQSMRAERQAILDQAADQISFLRLAETLTAFLQRLRQSAETLEIAERQKVVRLLVREVLVDNDTITIRHSIPAQAPTPPAGGAPLPSNGKLRVRDESYLLRSGSDYSALWNALLARSFQHDLQKMHDVRVINPLCHFFQQPVVPDIVKVGSQVKVEDARLPLDNCLGYSLDRVMCCPLGPISKRSRLEIRLEDRFEYELERALHHPVPDRRYRKDADFAPILRYLLPPGWEWFVGAPRQFVPQLLEQSLRAVRLNGLEGHPVYSRSPIVLFGHLIRCAQGLHLADVNV